MFVIFCYDANRKRDNRIRKIAMKYLSPVQRSVFQGELTEKGLRLLKHDLSLFLDPSCDSGILFCIPTPSVVTRQQIGICSSFSTIL